MNNLKLIRFVGIGKTGHTLIAAMLDAHPNVAIDNSYDSFSSIEELVERVKNKDPMKWSRGKYTFDIVGQKGKKDLKIIGTTKLMTPGEAADITIGCVRDPYEIAASLAGKYKNRFEHPIDRAIKEMKEAIPIWETADIVLSLERVCSNPRINIALLAHTVGIPLLSNWLKACTRAIDVPSTRKEFFYCSKEQSRQLNKIQEFMEAKHD